MDIANAAHISGIVLENPEAITVVAIEAVLRGEPEKSPFVLNDVRHSLL